MKILLTLQITVYLTLCFSAFAASPQSGVPVNPVSDQAFSLSPLDPKLVSHFRQIEEFKVDGLTGNRAHIQDMIDAINDNQFQSEPWLSLSRLGAVEALPTMDAKFKTLGFTLSASTCAFEFACRARLVAQAEASPHAMAVRFFQEIGETPEQLNAALANFYQNQTDHPNVMPGQYPFKEWRSEELLADMIYHGPSAALLADPLISKVDFHSIDGTTARLKLELALLTPEMQRQKLVDELAKGLEWLDCGQLLLDLGRPEAIEALKTKLDYLDKNYNSIGKGIDRQILLMHFRFALFICGDHYQSPIWKTLVNYHGIKSVAVSIPQEQNQFRTDY